VVRNCDEQWEEKTCEKKSRFYTYMCRHENMDIALED